MSDKPEPRINKDKVPWCSEEACSHFLDIGDSPIYECTLGKFCFELPPDTGTLSCLPAVREMAAEVERLRELVARLPKDRNGVTISFGDTVRVEFPDLGMRLLMVNEIHVDSDGVGSVNEGPGNWRTRAGDCEVVRPAG